MPARTRNAFRMQSLPLVAGFLVLGAIVLSRAWQIEEQRADNVAVRQAFQVERTLGTILSLLQDAETGQRGYVITGSVDYLEPYEAAVRSLPARMADLDVAMPAGSPQRSRFEDLQGFITQKLAVVKRIIDLKREGDAAAAATMLQEGDGKASMDEIRRIIRGMRLIEENVLSARLAESEARENSLRLGSLLALIGVVALGTFGIWDARRRMRTIIAAQKDLEASNIQLSSEIAQREAAETQVRQMQKMEAVGQLSGGIAHDFNNMLAVILSALNLLQRKITRGETDVGNLVEAAVDGATRAATLTARLLAFSRQQPLEPVVLEVNRLVAGMSDMLRRTLGPSIEIETVLAGGVWRTRADAGQLENAILNLAVNARDAMPGGGRLTIETANCHLDEGYSREHPDVPAGQYVLVALTDSGDGMPADVIARAFDPFFTTKPTGKGTGLGLSQVFGFVKQSGGHVKIYSEPGEGTTVKIYLPRHFGESPVQETVLAAEHETVQRSLKVLVVEDEERVRRMTVAAFRELGHTVQEAASGPEALAILEATPEIDLVFTDIVMPGMTGRQLSDAIHERWPHIPLIFTTGFTRNAIVHNGVLDPGVHLLAKPFTVEALARKIREVAG